MREPHVAVEVEAYRPFFILGEVTLPGQYPYVANMTVETAVAIAGGYTPRAFKRKIEISRQVDGADRTARRVAELSGAPRRHRPRRRTLVLTSHGGADPLAQNSPRPARRRSAGCSAMSSISRARRPRAAIRSASSRIPRPAARAPMRRSPRSRDSSRWDSTRVPMSRHVGASDVSAQRHVAQRARETRRRRAARPRRQGRRLCAACGGRRRSASTRRTAAACITAAARRSGSSI